MEHTNSPESSFGRIPSTRSDADLETPLYPLAFYSTLFQTDVGQALAITQEDQLFVEQPLTVDHAGNAYGNPGRCPYVENSIRRTTQPLSTGDLFGLRAQDAADDGHQPSGPTATAVSNPYSQDLHLGNHDTPASNGHVVSTPDSSTVPENGTTGSSTPSLYPINPGSQQPCMSVWNAGVSDASERRCRKRRKMTEDELVRNRALKAAGGACEICRRRKKKCTHRDHQLILSAPASTPAYTSTPAPAPAVPAPTLAQNLVPVPAAAPIPSRRVSTTNRHNLVPRTRLVRRLRDDINRRAAPVVPQHHQQHNPSVTSSYGHTFDPSMFSPSEGGASSNGTMSSTLSDANTFPAGEHHHLEMGVQGQIGLDTVGFGQQFNGQPAPEFDPMNAENALGTLENWLREHLYSNSST